MQQQRTFAFLERLSKSNHQIILIQGSKFDNKAWALCKSTDSFVRLIGSYFARTLRYDSNRCRTLNPQEVAELSQELAGNINPDDHYLIRAQLTVAGAILVTTDLKLKKIILEHDLECLDKEEFFRTYFP